MLSEKEKNKIEKISPAGGYLRYIDYAYFIGVMLVVFGHSHPLGEWNIPWYESVDTFIYRFHMPLFFFIGGFLLVHSGSIDKEGYSSWMKKKLLKFGVPYLVLTLVAYVPKYLLGDTTDAVELNLVYLLKNIFVIPREGVWGHFWFIYVYLVFCAVWALWRAHGKNKIVLWIGAVVSLLLSVIQINTEYFALADVSANAVYYAGGILLAEYFNNEKDDSRRDVIGLCICVVGSVLLYPYYEANGIFEVIETFLLVGCVWKISHILALCHPAKVIQLVSRYAFTIYIYAWPAQAVMETILRRAGITGNPVIGLLFITGMMFPAVVLLVYSKFKQIHCSFFDYLFGMKTT